MILLRTTISSTTLVAYGLDGAFLTHEMSITSHGLIVVAVFLILRQNALLY